MDDLTSADALRESEELHRITLSNISDAVFITDEQGVFTYICSNCGVIFGYTSDEVQAMGRISRLLGRELLDPARLATDGEMRNLEIDITAKSGVRRALLVNLKRVSIRGGTVLYVCRDITERKVFEDELREQLRFEGLISGLSARFAGLSDSDVIRGIEPSLRALGQFLGVERLVLWDSASDPHAFTAIGTWRAEGVPPVALRLLHDKVPLIGSMVLIGESFSFTRSQELPDGPDRRFIETQGLASLLVVPISIGGSWLGALSFGTMSYERDWDPRLVKRLSLVGEIFGTALARHRAAAAMAEARIELFHASRLSVVGELTAVMAHEIRQPLTSIASNASVALHMLSSRADRTADLREILLDIRAENRRANDVLTRLGALLHKRELELRPVDVNEVVGDVVRLVQADADQRQVRLELDTTPDLPSVKGDRMYLQQVLLNLIFNGMDAMREIPSAQRRLAIRTTRDRTGVAVTVADSGPGITDAAAPRIFDAFFTTKENGMGLGLSIVRSIVEAHGGQIGAENASAGGALFRFTLPIAG